jgi:hypothetical protein
MKKSRIISEKIDIIIERHRAFRKYVLKTAPPENLAAKRSQGGVQFPTGGNCAQCA